MNSTIQTNKQNTNYTNITYMASFQAKIEETMKPTANQLNLANQFLKEKTVQNIGALEVIIKNYFTQKSIRKTLKKKESNKLYQTIKETYKCVNKWIK